MPGGPAAASSGRGDLAEAAGRDIEDEAVDRHAPEPRVGPQPLDRRPDARLEVVERPERDVERVARSRGEPCGRAWRPRRRPESPHPVWPMTTISSVPSSCWLTISERMTSSVARPPALRMMWASPVRRPSASSTSSRASMQATMARPRTGRGGQRRCGERLGVALVLGEQPVELASVRHVRGGSVAGAEQERQPAARAGSPRSRAPTRRPAEPGASGGSGGAPAPSVNGDLLRAAEAVAARLLDDVARLLDALELALEPGDLALARWRSRRPSSRPGRSPRRPR